MELPGYDEWKTHNPDDDRCEFCGVHPRECHAGWQPDRCTGECGKGWRDPDAEYDAMRDEQDHRILYDLVATSVVTPEHLAWSVQKLKEIEDGTHELLKKTDHRSK